MPNAASLLFLVKRASVLLAIVVAAGCDRCEEKRASPPREAAPPPPPPCPEETALVEDGAVRVCVDRYEAAIEGWRFSQTPDLDAGVPRAVPAKGVKPQTNVSALHAQAACAAAGKRLCTAVEWTAACRGPDKRLFPYGNKHVDGACNEGRPSPVLSLGVSTRHLDDPRLAEADGGIEPGGSFPRCVGSYGIFDLNGNVHEWVSDTRPDSPRFGVFLGGFFADVKANGEGCLYRTTAHYRDYHDYSTGFRCCKDPT